MADTLRPRTPATRPGPREQTGLHPEDPDTRGTLVLTMLMLVLIGGGWLVAYLLLLGR